MDCKRKNALAIIFLRAHKQPMTIREYLSRPGSLSRADLSKELGISRGRLTQISDRDDLPPHLALKLEKVTRGAVCAADVSTLIAEARAA